MYELIIPQSKSQELSNLKTNFFSYIIQLVQLVFNDPIQV